MEIQDIFDEIYNKRIWGDGSLAKPLSGSGSNPDNAKTYVDFVRKAIQRLGLKKVIDIGHGDFEMWRDWQFAEVEYLGIDISAVATSLARSKYSSDNLRFSTLDLTKVEEIPYAELLIIKDCLQHLPNFTILKLLEKFSNYKYLIICNDIQVPFESRLTAARHYLRLRTRMKNLLQSKSPFFLVHTENNTDIEPGDFRGLDLEKTPFVDSLPGHELIETIDYDGPKRDGIKKRIYFYTKVIAN
jgi:hypothetical protein